MSRQKQSTEFLKTTEFLLKMKVLDMIQIEIN